METISYKLPDFEGPLDLLLFLVQKNKLNIYDIPISQVLEQYLAAIQQMKDYNMDVASEFLEMAARLVRETDCDGIRLDCLGGAFTPCWNPPALSWADA